MSVRPHEITRLPTYGFSRSSVLQTFMTRDKMYVVRSLHVYTSSAKLTARHHFTRRSNFMPI